MELEIRYNTLRWALWTALLLVRHPTIIIVNQQYMADKVQFVLEDVLDEAAYLVRKGIFSQGELQQQMKKR